MASPSSKPYDLEITIISAKHLKNVNWRNGILKPYCIFRVEPDRWLSTKSDDSGSTKPVWNEKFTLPLPSPPQDSHLTLEIFHSKPSETPKPLVGTLSLNLRDLFVDDLLLTHLKNFDLLRPSGRPHGQVRLKLALRHRAAQNYQNTATAAPAPAPAPALNPHQPQHSYYYSSAPPAPPPRDYRGYSSNSSIHEATAPSHNPYHYGGSGGYGSYYQGYYPQQAPSPQPPRPVFERQASYLGPSAPVDRPVFERQGSYGGPGPSAPVDRPVFERQASYGGPSAPVDRPVVERQASYLGPSALVDRPVFERQASYGGPGPSAPVDRPVFERQASYGGSGPSAPVDRPVFERQASYGGPSAPVDRPVFERQDGRPSAPVDYMAYDHKRGGGSKAGWGSGLGVRAMAGAFGGLALDEGIKYEDDKISERVESESVAKDGYGNYRVDY